MPIIASALAAIVPMFIYLIIIWRFDRYDREPFKLVLTNYFWGAIGAIIFAIIGSWLISSEVAFFIPNKSELGHIDTILVAPFVEEITKGIFLFIIVTNKRFDNLTDGIVYGGAIGLGFGMTENFLYFLAYGSTLSQWISIVIIRTLFSAVMHCVATATFGAFLGLAKFKSLSYKIVLPVIGLAIAIFIHSAWNFSVSFKSTTVFGFIFMFFTITVFFIVFSLAVKNEKKIIYRELFEEAQNGLIPQTHPAILKSAKRNKSGWVDESIRKSYIKNATTLAFRKMELKNSKGLKREYYRNDVENYRNIIHKLLTESQLNQ